MVRRVWKSLCIIFIQKFLVGFLCVFFATVQTASSVPVFVVVVFIAVHLFICSELPAGGSPRMGKNEFGNVSFLVLVLESRPCCVSEISEECVIAGPVCIGASRAQQAFMWMPDSSFMRGQ